MKLKSARLLGSVTFAIIAGGRAHAAYTGLSAEVHTTISTGSGPKSVYRIYANFTDCEDLLFGWSGPTTDPIQIRSETPFGQPGSNFFNPGGTASNTAPTLDQINGTKTTPAIPNIQWGTFATIGVPVADMGSGPTQSFPNIDQTSLSPGFGTFISGNQFVQAGSVFAVPQPTADSQGRAGYDGDGDAGLRVLMMQLTVNLGDVVELETDVQAQLGGSGQTVTFEDQTLWLGVADLPPCFGADFIPPGGNGQVNVDELIAVINGWGACNCLQDVTPSCGGDGLVNVDDLLFIIDHWGPCFP